jgi:hypothetical protein
MMIVRWAQESVNSKLIVSRTFVHPEIKKIQAERQELDRAIKEDWMRHPRQTGTTLFGTIIGLHPCPSYLKDVKNHLNLSKDCATNVLGYSAIGCVTIMKRDVSFEQKCEFIQELHQEKYQVTIKDKRTGLVEWLERMSYDQIINTALCLRSFAETHNIPHEIVNLIAVYMAYTEQPLFDITMNSEQLL